MLVSGELSPVLFEMVKCSILDLRIQFIRVASFLRILEGQDTACVEKYFLLAGRVPEPSSIQSVLFQYV